MRPLSVSTNKTNFDVSVKNKVGKYGGQNPTPTIGQILEDERFFKLSALPLLRVPFVSSASSLF